MENLPEKINAENSVTLFSGKMKSIELYRKMLDVPAVATVLNKVDKIIFVALTKKQICEIDGKILLEKMAEMFSFIAKDIGYIIPKSDASDWNYTCSRLFTLLQNYYSQLTLSEIKLAFELLIIGELDEYLPKDRDGRAERKHFQQFNAEYFTKILNAYLARRSKVITKAFTALPGHKEVITPEQKKYYDHLSKLKCLSCYLQYKYSGKLEFRMTDEIVVYGWLCDYDLVEDVFETMEDRNEAYHRFMSRVNAGLVNKFVALQVRNDGLKSPEIYFTAFEIARRRAIQKAFDAMIKDEIYIYDVLKFNDYEN